MDPSALGINCHLNQHCPSHHECSNNPAAQHLDQKPAHPKDRTGWRRVVLNFTPSWFSVNMGTGIVSILLHNLPYNAPWLYWISVGLFALNTCLFILFMSISVLRYTMFPGIWRAMLQHPVQSLFLGTIPMGLATIVDMAALVCVPAWGHWAAVLCWTLWWVDVVMAVSSCVYLPFVIMSVHESQISTMTAAWLLPIIPTIVASASGSIVASVLPNPQHALWTLITSYILWGSGVPLSMCVLCIYFLRLTHYHLPPREVIVSVFLPLGPLGQGGFAIMQLGKVAMEILPKTGSIIADAGRELYVLGLFIALIMWGFGLVWLFFAVASISKNKFPFNMGWWGFTFPLGVFTLSTTMIGKELPSLFFTILAMIFSIVVVVLWLLVSIRTIEKTFNGSLLFAPCPKEYEDAIERAKRKTSREGSARHLESASEGTLNSSFSEASSSVV